MQIVHIRALRNTDTCERTEFIFFFNFLYFITPRNICARCGHGRFNEAKQSNIFPICVFMCYIVLFISFFVILRYYQVDVFFYLVFGYIIEEK